LKLRGVSGEDVLQVGIPPARPSVSDNLLKKGYAMASQKALNVQKRIVLGSRFCGGFTCGPLTVTGAITDVGVPRPCGGGDRYLALTEMRNGSAGVWTPAGA
jgi:hypothetical protein